MNKRRWGSEWVCVLSLATKERENSEVGTAEKKKKSNEYINETEWVREWMNEQGEEWMSEWVFVFRFSHMRNPRPWVNIGSLFDAHSEAIPWMVSLCPFLPSSLSPLGLLSLPLIHSPFPAPSIHTLHCAYSSPSLSTFPPTPTPSHLPLPVSCLSFRSSFPVFSFSLSFLPHSLHSHLLPVLSILFILLLFLFLLSSSCSSSFAFASFQSHLPVFSIFFLLLLFFLFLLLISSLPFSSILPLLLFIFLLLLS